MHRRLHVDLWKSQCQNSKTAEYYDDIQSGYDAAEASQVIYVHEGAFAETLALNNPEEVSVKGGYNCNFSSNNGTYTTVRGSLTVGAVSGGVKMANIVIR